MDVFVARQPIFDQKQNVVAYELLFRQGRTNAYDGIDANEATLSVITNGFLEIGMQTLTDGKQAFINFTESLLTSDIVTGLPKDIIVIEILENVEITDEVVAACKKWKALGYVLALDDFEYDPKYKPLFELVDIIKVDFKLTQGYERRKIIKTVNSSHIKFLAEKVETMEEYTNAIKDGYTYFQGYFFSKPVILSAREMPSYKNSYTMLMAELSQPDLNFEKLESIIKRDMSLSYKLLKFINSASFGFKAKVDSIKHALMLLGREQVSKWIYLLALKDMGDRKPDELMRTSVVRAKFGETIAQHVGLGSRSDDVFFMGMMSLIHAITDLPMEKAISQIPISDDIKDALLGKENRFRDIFELILGYEAGNWDAFMKYAEKLNFKEETAPELYIKALEWSDEFMHI